MRTLMPTPRRRAAYLADTMADVRHLEGLSRSFDVVFISPRFLGDRATNQWPPRPPAVVERVGLGGGRLGFMARAAMWLRHHRRDVDVVYVLDNLTAALAANLGRVVGGPPVVLQVGRPTVEYTRCKAAVESRVRNLVRRWAATVLVAVNERRADGIGAVSDYCADQCRRHNSRVRSIPWYGVDVDAFAPRWSRLEARRDLELALDEPVVMLRSRIAPEKDPDTYLLAIALLRRQGRRVRAVYMGGEYRQLAARAAELGVEVIARQPADMDEIPKWYVAADVDVQTSHTEGLGVSPLEALACGTPVVVTNVGGLPEVVDGGRVGLLVERGDVEGLACAIARLLDDPQMAAAMAAEGRAWVRQRFSQEQAFADWVALGVEVAGERERSNRPVRVLFIDHEWRLSGGERDLVDLVRGFPKGAVEPHAALPVDGPLAEALRQLGVTVHLVPMADSLRRVSRWDLARRPITAVATVASVARASVALIRLARRLRPDVVHTNSMKAHLLAVPAAAAVRRPLVWHVRDILEEGWLRSFLAVVGRLAADRIVCISRAVGASFEGTPASRGVQVVHNGVRPVPPAAPEVEAFRASVGAGPDDVLVGIVGQLAWWKGHDVFLRAAATVAASVPTARFVVVGSCLFPENEAAYERELHSRATVLGLDDRLVWTGHVEPIEPVMAGLDVLVHASRLPEPFGRVMVEAMALGTPVVTTDIGAGPELVTPGAGAIVPPDDADALAAAIIRLAPTRAAAGRLASAARSAAAPFDISATAAATLEIYGSLRR